jgi:hypothetical protein
MAWRLKELGVGVWNSHAECLLKRHDEFNAVESHRARQDNAKSIVFGSSLRRPVAMPAAMRSVPSVPGCFHPVSRPSAFNRGYPRRPRQSTRQLGGPVRRRVERQTPIAVRDSTVGDLRDCAAGDDPQDRAKRVTVNAANALRAGSSSARNAMGGPC